MRNITFWLNPAIVMESVNDSMQLDSYQDIACLKDTARNITVSIEVRGDVKVWFNRQGGNPFDGEYFSSPSEFPEELRALIRDCRDWYLDDRLYVLENNWFEAFVDAPAARCQFGSELVDVEGMSTEDLTGLLYELYRCWRNEIYSQLAFRKAKAYAKASLYYFNSSNIRLASRYWSRIYGLCYLSSKNLVDVMGCFPDDAVFSITDYIRKRTYKAQGLIK